jgi:protein-S-isoprenylcysteine O-methyltransferase Ste14
MGSKRKRSRGAGRWLDGERKPRKPADHRAPGGKHSEWERAFWRWLAASLVMLVLFLIYNYHPYYLRLQFTPWRPFYNIAFVSWLALGIPYAVVTLRRFGGSRMNLTDGAVHWLLLFRGIFYWVFEGCRWPSHVWDNRRMRVSVLSLGVKAFFTPLMTIFMAEHTGRIVEMWFRRKGVTAPTPERLNEMWRQGWDAWYPYLADVLPRVVPNFNGLVDGLFTFTARDYWWWAGWAYQWLFFMDTIWALTGYAVESRWLNNKTKSVEPTLFGWMVALMCYPPFNDVSGTYFPLSRNGQWQIIHDQTALIICNFLMTAAFFVYVWATLAFGPTFSNLTNRGIITRGPYAVIRHPAYACKNFAWWMEYLPYCGGFHNVLPLIAWNTIYGLRAWTEERHLSRDPDYLAYKKKVRWAAIPGIY